MVFSKIVPSLDDLDFNAQVVNALVYKSLADKGVTISKNVGFYNDGVIGKLLYDDDGIHLNKDKGSKCLARRTRFTICRCLNIRIESRPLSDSRNYNTRRREGGGRSSDNNRNNNHERLSKL